MSDEFDYSPHWQNIVEEATKGIIFLKKTKREEEKKRKIMSRKRMI